MQLLNEYFNIQKQLYEYFGYVEDWKVFPIEDSTEYYWYLDGEGPGIVHFADTEEMLELEMGNYYKNEIHTLHNLSKWVYRGKDYTMVVVDTRADGNKFLQIFDNSKERKPGSVMTTSNIFKPREQRVNNKLNKQTHHDLIADNHRTNLSYFQEQLEHFGFDPHVGGYLYIPRTAMYWSMCFTSDNLSMRILYAYNKEDLDESKPECRVIDGCDPDNVKVSKTGFTMVKTDNTYILFNNAKCTSSKS